MAVATVTTEDENNLLSPLAGERARRRPERSRRSEGVAGPDHVRTSPPV